MGSQSRTGAVVDGTTDTDTDTDAGEGADEAGGVGASPTRSWSECWVSCSG
ncbi:hypothetical protein [Streptomyces sp. MST-110588]|uniref:hypothetical protein n=1 Tax=Streptomyces sp. MST-110588 TaxID=2833628 RepID=UPI001F5CDFEC|nr:hypothetical protein [Streptomyces sp. MST-110588]UNO40564.1 hypothetical protein KGS77_14480 [Streptomyces sp. MST-110588]